jgi:hypothetical protein
MFLNHDIDKHNIKLKNSIIVKNVDLKLNCNEILVISINLKR